MVIFVKGNQWTREGHPSSYQLQATVSLTVSRISNQEPRPLGRWNSTESRPCVIIDVTTSATLGLAFGRKRHWFRVPAALKITAFNGTTTTRHKCEGPDATHWDGRHHTPPGSPERSPKLFTCSPESANREPRNRAVELGFLGGFPKDEKTAPQRANNDPMFVVVPTMTKTMMMMVWRQQRELARRQTTKEGGTCASLERKLLVTTTMKQCKQIRFDPSVVYLPCSVVSWPWCRGTNDDVIMKSEGVGFRDRATTCAMCDDAMTQEFPWAIEFPNKAAW